MKICSYKNCHNKHCARGLCKAHTKHLYRYGEPRLTSMLNEIEISKDIAYIVIYDRHRLPKVRAIIDKDEVEKIKKIHWGFNGQYVKEGTSKYVHYLHHKIIGKPQNGLVVDHINRNKLDNRKSNLRFVTKGENNKNK